MRIEFFFPVCTETVNKQVGDEIAGHFGGWTRCTCQGAWLNDDSVIEEEVHHYTALTNASRVEATSWITLLFLPIVSKRYSEVGQEQVEFMFAIDSAPVFVRV